jgi:hypothetical protein
VADLASRKVVVEFEFELLNAYFGLEHLARKRPVKFFDSLVRG